MGFKMFQKTALKSSSNSFSYHLNMLFGYVLVLGGLIYTVVTVTQQSYDTRECY